MNYRATLLRGAGVLALSGWVLFGAWVGSRLQLYVPHDVVAGFFGLGTIVLAVLHYGASQVDAHLKSAIDVLRNTQSAKTQRLLSFALRRRRQQAVARASAAILAAVTIAFTGLFTSSLKDLSVGTISTGFISVAQLLAIAAGASMAVQLFVTALALWLWLDAEQFEADAHRIATLERDRLEFMRSVSTQASQPIRPSSEQQSSTRPGIVS